ncbi:hypothetical protein B0H11DRAFT_2246846 [Mycena galericulata]|nr:hypothetical protein B0H11DRAFT_2246846 [Mycena galericulata]
MSSSSTSNPSLEDNILYKDYWIFIRLIPDSDFEELVRLFQRRYLEQTVAERPDLIPELLKRVLENFHDHTSSRAQYAHNLPYQGKYFMAGMRRIYEANPRHEELVPDLRDYLDYNVPFYDHLSDRLDCFQLPDVNDPIETEDPVQYEYDEESEHEGGNPYIADSQAEESNAEESSGAEVGGFAQPREDSDSSESDSSSSESDSAPPEVPAKRKATSQAPKAVPLPAAKKVKTSTAATTSAPAPSRPKPATTHKPRQLTARDKGKAPARSKVVKTTRVRKTKDEVALSTTSAADWLANHPHDLTAYARNEHSEMKRLGIRGTPVVTYSEDMLQSQVARTRALAIARVNRWFEDPRFPKTACTSCSAALKTCVPQGVGFACVGCEASKRGVCSHTYKSSRRLAVDTAFFKQITGSNSDVVSSMVDDFEMAAAHQQQLAEAAFKAEVDTLYRLRKLLYYLVTTFGELAPNDPEYHHEPTSRLRERLFKMANHLSVFPGTAVKRDDQFPMPSEPLWLPSELAPTTDLEGLLQVDFKEPLGDLAPSQPVVESGLIALSPPAQVKREPVVAAIPGSSRDIKEVIDLVSRSPSPAIAGPLNRPA